MEDRCRLVTNLAGTAVRRIRLGSRRVDHTVAGHQCTCRRDSGTPTRSTGSTLHAPTQTIRYEQGRGDHRRQRHRGHVPGNVWSAGDEVPYIPGKICQVSAVAC